MYRLYVFVCIIGLTGMLRPATTAAQETRLLYVNVIHDGASSKPGQLLNVHGFLGDLKGRSAVNIEVRLIAFDKEGNMTPVKSSRPEFSDKDGYFCFIEPGIDEYELDRPAHLQRFATFFEVDCEVPYDAINLPEGRHDVSYEIAIYEKNRRVSTITSSIVPFIIGGPRPLGTEKEWRRREMDATAWFVEGDVPKEVSYKAVVFGIEDTHRPRPDVLVPNGFTLAQKLTSPPSVQSGEVHLRFATTRNVLAGDAPDGRRFGNVPGDKLTMGTCAVQIPRNHRRGELEGQGWFSNPQDYFRFTALLEVGEPEMHQMLQGELDKDDILIYVHGFANSFDSAAYTLAQIKEDTQFRGGCVLFSWSSKGRVGVGEYKDDELAASKAAPLLAAFVRRVVEERKGRGRVHVVAHSMGCRIVADALLKLDGWRIPEKSLGHVVLAAPDIDAADFVLPFASIRKFASRVTIYHSRNDVALVLSRAIHAARRLGQSPYLDPVNTPDNVDANQVGTSTFRVGHDYFSRTDELLIDMQMLLVHDKVPEKRETIRETKIHEVRCWEFP